MYTWEYNDPLVIDAAKALELESPEGYAALLALMEAIVFDPMEYQRTPDEPVGKPVRKVPFWAGRGQVTVLIWEPDLIVLVLKVQWV